jgi:NAD(P)H-nitrite reductase large subunit
MAGARAAGLDTAAQRLRLAGGADLTYDRLVLATGARAVRLDVAGAELPGVLTLRDVSDLEALLARAVPGARAVVVGGGNVGLQVCEGLLARGLHVTTVVRSPYLLSQSVDEEAGRRIGAVFESHGLRIRTGRDVRTIAGKDRVQGVGLDDGETLPADLVVVGKGIVPNVDWLAESGVGVGRGVRVDAYGRTNVAEVYAAGDCAESADPLSGEPAVSGVWPVAMEMGRVAGSSAVGVPRSSPGALRLNAMTFFQVPIISVGEPREGRVAGATARVLVRRGESYRKVVLLDGKLVGALLYGDVSGAGAFYRLYRNQVPLEDEEALTLAALGVHP